MVSYAGSFRVRIRVYYMVEGKGGIAGKCFYWFFKVGRKEYVGYVGLGLVNLNNVSEFWGIRVVFVCLLFSFGMIMVGL